MFFLGVHKLPDPVLKENGHYEPFDTVYGAVTFWEWSSNAIPSVGKVKQCNSLPFNVTLLLQYEECEMWTLLLSKKKSTKP